MRGVRVALDNFGKDPVSASRAPRLPLTEIKIDRTFVRGLPDGRIARGRRVRGAARKRAWASR
jgi:EAL domain-containing protein (putative c-di-GMP-specific phosphodiesterase class I)